MVMIPIVELKQCANLFHFTSQLFAIINFCVAVYFFLQCIFIDWSLSAVCGWQQNSILDDKMEFYILNIEYMLAKWNNKDQIKSRIR